MTCEASRDQSDPASASLRENRAKYEPQRLLVCPLSPYLGAAPSSTALENIVSAPNGSSKTYSINVNRAAPTAPPAPAGASDLPAECDSGFLPGQDADNTTSNLTPSVRVAPPAAGEIPNLYIDGVKVKERFDQGSDTLTPTNQLLAGNTILLLPAQ